MKEVSRRKKKVLIVLGTRPEGIKLAPLYLKMKQYQEEFDVKICSTGQHREMLDQVFDFFDIKPDFDLNIMKSGQTLSEVTSSILLKMDEIFDQFNPDVTIVQGDTTTVLTGALAAFYRNIKIAHVEAGLRTWDVHTPFPEEANRVLVSKITDYHFAPTQTSYENLIRDGVDKDKVFITGNTVTDAVVRASDIVVESDQIRDRFLDIDFENKKVILLTSHRRENLGKGLVNICKAVVEISKRDDVEFVFPVHLNPKVREVVNRYLGGLRNVHLYDPFDYPELVWMMKNCYAVLTDSGGIQEEAPSLGKPVLVLRESTERPEGVEAGTAMLVGTDKDLIISKTIELLDNTNGLYDKMAHAVNPYGDGSASQAIVDILRR